jgi:hypothetical protein
VLPSLRAYSHSDANSDTDSYGHVYTNAFSHPNSDSQAYAYTSASSHSGAASKPVIYSIGIGDNRRWLSVESRRHLHHV